MMNVNSNSFAVVAAGLFRRSLLWAIVCAGTVAAQMVSPDLDNPAEPFSYYSAPTDVIGVMDAVSGTEVTPEGYLYTGYDELMFFTGNPPEPFHQRVKTLLNGYLPVVVYQTEKNGIHYEVTAFAATLDGNPESPLMNFVRVKIRNAAEEERTAFWSAGTRYQCESNTESGTGDHRFVRPLERKILGGKSQAGVLFNPDWTYEFSKDAFLRSDSVIYLFPDLPSSRKMMTLSTFYNRPQDLKARKMKVLPTTPVGIVSCAIHLAPGEEKALVFKMPYAPLPSGSPLVGQLRDADFEEYLQRTVKFWDGILAKGIDIELPELKVENTFKANLIYDLIARNKEEGCYIQKVNDFQYHSFYLRDASFIVRMYLLSGYFDIARECVQFFPRWQQLDGNFVSQGGQFDGWGQTMWIYGQYYRFTHDKQFAKSVYPYVLKAFDWLENARDHDPLRLMPPTSPGDNEDIQGHITGHNFWALDGLRNVMSLIQGVGPAADLSLFQEQYNDFYSTVARRLRSVTASTGGYIPPGLDGKVPAGQDWGNMLTLYPEMLFSPFDTMVTATLDSTRAKYMEGIMTYGDKAYLHDYLTIRNTQAELVRNEQEKAVNELYSLLLHTSSTHAGFEYAIRPWGARDFDGNLSPHGWFAAEIRSLIRNMMVREQSQTFGERGDLHLFSCVSPEWVKNGERISVHHAPTYYGEVNCDLAFEKGKALLTLNNRWDEAPEHLVLHLPWFMKVESVAADGKKMKINDSRVDLPLNSKRVEIRWERKSKVPDLSYDVAVKSYEKQYRQKYEEFLKTGK